jgi:hypothetical protein
MEVVLAFESTLDMPDEATIEAEFNCRVESMRVRDSDTDEWEEM